MSRGIEVRGSDRTQGVPRALGFGGQAAELEFDEGLPGADIKNAGDFARLEFGLRIVGWVSAKRVTHHLPRRESHGGLRRVPRLTHPTAPQRVWGKSARLRGDERKGYTSKNTVSLSPCMRMSKR